MPAQIVGSYTWYAEWDEENGEAMYSNALTDAEAIAAAVDCVRERGCKCHVRRSGVYLAEARPGYQGAIIVEEHGDNGEVWEYTVPCFMRLVAAWLDHAAK